MKGIPTLLPCAGVGAGRVIRNSPAPTRQAQELPPRHSAFSNSHRGPPSPRAGRRWQDVESKLTPNVPSVAPLLPE